jgi:ABC-type lipoprotein release transport system permease subunit
MEGFRSELERRIRGTASDIKVESKVYIGLRDRRRVEDLLSRIEGVAAVSSYAEALVLYRADHRILQFRLAEQDADDRYLQAMDLANPHAASRLDEYVAAVSPPDLTSQPPTLAALAGEVFANLPKNTAALFSSQWIEEDLWAPYRGFRTLPDGPLPPPAVVGLECYRRELLLPGDRIQLTSFSPVTNTTAEGEFLVVGYFKTGLYELDAKGIVLPLSDAADFLQLHDDEGDIRVSGARVTADERHADGPALLELRNAIDRTLAENGILLVRTQTWREARQSLLQAVRVEKSIVSIILGVVILFAGFMIFIILTVQVVEKSRDIGVLQSLGGTSRGIAAVFFTVGLNLCVAGTLLGAAYGVALALHINTLLRWLRLLTGLEIFPEDVYYLDHIPVRFQAEDLLFIIIPTVAASLLASVIPALRATRKDPAAALRYE